jgi:plasmid stabilization system protein ParE
MNIRWTEPAVLDLESIRDYIARDSDYYATEFIGRILDAVEKLYMLPSMGRKVPEAYDDNIREIIFYNYRIIYMIERAESILVLAVIHAARDLNNINPCPWEVT